MKFRDHVALQRDVTRYLQELGPTLNYGRYYLQYVVRCSVELGPGATTAQLLRQTAERYGRTPDSVRSSISRFTRSICKGEDKDLLIQRWRGLGWDGETELTASVAIPLACQGFLPHLRQRHPDRYQALLWQRRRMLEEAGEAVEGEEG